jgi:putative inorganic carbon (HCO3(-)) transporter
MTTIFMGMEFLLLTVLYAIFMFSDKVPLAGLAALGLLWIVRWWATGRLTVATPLDGPILGILAILPLSLYISVDWSLSLPKVYGIILGVAIFYAVVNSMNTIRRAEFTVLGLIGLGLAVTGLGLVGTDWAESKLFSLPQVYKLIPHLIQAAPRSATGGGIHFNVIGGALTFFIPLLAGLLWNGRKFKQMGLISGGRWSGVLYAGYWIILSLTFVLASSTLLLAQSRGSYLGVAAGLLFLAIWHDRRFLWLVPLATLALFVMIQTLGAGNLVELVSSVDTTGGNTLPVRMEIWKRAIYLIQDFPFSGAGIGTFDLLTKTFYPFFSRADFLVPHAHNMFLTMAVDLGIPGLVLYAALLSGFAFSIWGAYREVTDSRLRVLMIGLACGMLAHQVFGIMDAYMLGTKLGAVMWIYFGLAAALYLNRKKLAAQVLETATMEQAGGDTKPGEDNERKVDGEKTPGRLGNLLMAFGYWAAFSLLAIAFIGDRPYWGLVIAVVGGVVLGWICVTTCVSKPQQEKIPAHGWKNERA